MAGRGRRSFLLDRSGREVTPIARMVCSAPRNRSAITRLQLATLADTAVDMVTAYTLTTAAEAVGLVRAAVAVGLPIAISFTVETDGRLPDGQALQEAIEEVDAATDGAASYFMINCAHPTHFADTLPVQGSVRERIRGLRANASSKSHAELDKSETLDAGDPVSLAAHYQRLRRSLPNLNVIGGCCGTDHRHIAAICEAWTKAN